MRRPFVEIETREISFFATAKSSIAKTLHALQEELSSTENRVAVARQAFNDAVMSYNTKRESFPDNVFAGMFAFGAAELLAATESAEERKAPKVSFT